MKATIFLNTMKPFITDEQIIEVMEGLEDPFYGKFVKEDLEVSVSLWDVRATMSGYGHWKISVQVELIFGCNKKKVTLTKITTDSKAIDDKNDDNDEIRSRGYLSLFSDCVNSNETEIYEALDIEE